MGSGSVLPSNRVYRIPACHCKESNNEQIMFKLIEISRQLYQSKVGGLCRPLPKEIIIDEQSIAQLCKLYYQRSSG